MPKFVIIRNLASLGENEKSIKDKEQYDLILNMVQQLRRWWKSQTSML